MKKNSCYNDKTTFAAKKASQATPGGKRGNNPKTKSIGSKRFGSGARIKK